jgi:hypothetical protein
MTEAKQVYIDLVSFFLEDFQWSQLRGAFKK